MSPITKDHAKDIQRKVTDPRKHLTTRLDTSGKAHDMVCVYYKGNRILEFGIRRGSNRNQGHGHLKNQLHLNERNLLRFAECTLSIEEWIAILRDLKVIDDDDGDNLEVADPKGKPDKPA